MSCETSEHFSEAVDSLEVNCSRDHPRDHPSGWILSLDTVLARGLSFGPTLKLYFKAWCVFWGMPSDHSCFRSLLWGGPAEYAICYHTLWRAASPWLVGRRAIPGHRELSGLFGLLLSEDSASGFEGHFLPYRHKILLGRRFQHAPPTPYFRPSLCASASSVVFCAVSSPRRLYRSNSYLSLLGSVKSA